MADETTKATHPGRSLKSVITCDLEGRIETFGADAEEIFGYRAEEVVGKKRVSLFSPGLVVLGHVPRWLEAARTQGCFETDTVFLDKDGSPFAAHIRITPTMKSGEQVGYCGVTTPLPGVDPEQVMPEIGLGTRIFAGLVVTRAPFLTATLVPVLVAAAWAFQRYGGAELSWSRFGLAAVGALALHVAANTFNDYFDWKSGTDQANNEYFLPFSGGSRSIELGLVTPGGLFAIGLAALGVAAAAGAALLAISSPAILLLGVVGAFSAFFYTAPPLRLAARRGLGELFVGLNFGPLVVLGTLIALRAGLDAEVLRAALVLGVPIGLLTTAILWINEFPDAPSDAATGKNHLVVVLGKRAARYGYLALLVGSLAILAGTVAAGLLPPLALLSALAAPLGVHASVILFRHFESRTLVRANAATIQLHLAAGLLLALGLTVSGAL